MIKNKVIKTGHKNNNDKSTKDWQTLARFWEFEEQMGRRQKPEDNLRQLIPEITLDKPDPLAGE